MDELTALTVADALRGLEKGDFTAVELADSHVRAMESRRVLNAYITETPERALEQAAASDSRRAKGDAGAMDGIPVAIKDLFCTDGVLTTAGSHILGARRIVGRFGDRGGGAFVMARPAPTRADRSASPRRSRGRSASSRPTGAVRAGALSRLRRRSIRRARSRARCATPRSCCAQWPGMIRRIPHPSISPCRISKQSVGKSIKGLKIGIPKEYRVDNMPPEIEKLWSDGAAWLKAAGAEIVEISLPHTKYALPLITSLRRRRLRPISRAMTGCATACAKRAAASSNSTRKRGRPASDRKCSGAS
jgi:aspartyl-tRNA(Asn)/glutamyl-tRNA(Gln) amidotransferase subunit A